MEQLSELEAAILHRMRDVNPRYAIQLGELARIGQIESRRWSGAGGFVTFARNEVHFQPLDLELDAEATIELPILEHGLGATLFVRDGRADWLEFYAYGEEWSGDITGFEIVPVQVQRGDDAA